MLIRIGITIHYVTNQFGLKNHLLVTKEFSDSHTAENLAEILQRILGEWKLSKDIISAVTTDNGSTIVLALALAGWGCDYLVSVILYNFLWSEQ